MKPANPSIRDENSSKSITVASLDVNADWQQFIANSTKQLKANYKVIPRSRSSSNSSMRILLLLNLGVARCVGAVVTNDELTLTNRMGEIDLTYRIPGRFSAEINEIYRMTTPTGALSTGNEKKLMQNILASVARQVDYKIANNKGFECTHFMVLFGDVEMLRRELIAGANPNAMTTSGFSLLQIAVEVVNPSIFAMLLEYGADPDLASKNYRSPRQRVENDGDCSREREILKKYDEKRRNAKQRSEVKLPIAASSQVGSKAYIDIILYFIFIISTSSYFALLKVMFFGRLIFTERNEISSEIVIKKNVPQKKKSKWCPDRTVRLESQILSEKSVTLSASTQPTEVVKPNHISTISIPENKAKLLVYDYEQQTLVESKKLFPFSRKTISARTQAIAKILADNGFSVSLGGGAFLYAALMADGNVKDKQSLPKPEDFDLETDAEIDDLTQLFPNLGQVVGNQYPLFEVYDAEGSVQIVHASDPRQKVRERDFTVNALKYDFETDSVVDYGGVKYPYSEDYFNRQIRTTSDTETKLRQDASRVLRAVTLSVKTRFNIDEKIINIIRQQKSLNVRSDLFYKRLIRLFLTGQARASLDILLENNWWNKIFISYNDKRINFEEAIRFLQYLCDKLDETYIRNRDLGKLETAKQRTEFQQLWTPLLLAGIFYYPLGITEYTSRKDIKSFIETEISPVVMIPQKIKEEWQTQTKTQLVDTYFALFNSDSSVTSECLVIQEILTRVAAEQAQSSSSFRNR